MSNPKEEMLVTITVSQITKLWERLRALQEKGCITGDHEVTLVTDAMTWAVEKAAFCQEDLDEGTELALR